MTVLAEIAPAWTTARAAGIGALLCASLSLSAGLLMALGPLRLRARKLELRAAHEALSLGTFALILVHGVALLLDPVLRPSLAELLVPFAASYERVGTAFGQLAAYGMLGLGATFYVRRHLGAQRWRRAHRWVAAFWALGVAHGLMTGTDAGTAWFLAVMVAPVACAAVLLSRRHHVLGALARST